MIKAVFPGSFDPPTFGHLNVIQRAKHLFDEIHVVIAVNKAKNTLFTEQERYAMMCELTKEWKTVFVHTCNTLIVDCAKKLDARVLLRGIRNIDDFSYEFDLSILNKGLSPQIETVFLPTEPKYFVLKSSAIKELASFGGNISAMVPPLVERALKEKFKQ